MLHLKERTNYKGRKSRLEQLGANEEKARMLAGSRKGLWATTVFRDLNYIITNKKLKAVGCPTFERYNANKQRKLLEAACTGRYTWCWETGENFNY